MSGNPFIVRDDKLRSQPGVSLPPAPIYGVVTSPAPSPSPTPSPPPPAPATARIMGSVFIDAGSGTPANDGNGLQDAGELGIAGVDMTLSGFDNLGAAVLLVATTNGSGEFGFETLRGSDTSGYALVRGNIPAVAGTFGDGLVTVGTAGGTATNTRRVDGIVLADAEQSTGYAFAALPAYTIFMGFDDVYSTPFEPLAAQYTASKSVTFAGGGVLVDFVGFASWTPANAALSADVAIFYDSAFTGGVRLTAPDYIQSFTFDVFGPVLISVLNDSNTVSKSFIVDNFVGPDTYRTFTFDTSDVVGATQIQFDFNTLTGNDGFALDNIFLTIQPPP